MFEPSESKASVPTAYSASQAVTYEDARFASPGGRRVNEIEMGRLIDAYDRLASPSRVLEVGVGTGRFLPVGERLGHQVFGVDASMPMMAQIRAADSSVRVTELAAGEAARLPFVSAAFDLVYAIRLLSQTSSVSYARATIAEMIRVTTLGGWCLIECLSADRPTPRRTTQVRLTALEIEAACRAAGAEVVTVDGRFMIGMTTLRRTPGPLVGAAAALDATMSGMSSRRCSRIYVLARRVT